MSSNSTIINARIDPELKKAVEAILKKLGLTAAEAIRMYFAQIAHKQKIPFSLDLETDDVEGDYIKAEDENHLKNLIGID